MRALVERGEADARRIAALERALTIERRNLGDLKTVRRAASIQADKSRCFGAIRSQELSEAVHRSFSHAFLRVRLFGVC